MLVANRETAMLVVAVNTRYNFIISA